MIMAPFTAATLLVIAALGVNLDTFLFVAAVTTLSFIWTFATPFNVPFLIAADPSRRTAMYSSAVQLVGCAVGPFFSSLFA